MQQPDTIVNTTTAAVKEVYYDHKQVCVPESLILIMLLDELLQNLTLTTL